ncbi:tudor domain-containing protein 15 [Tachyglossus aculeatus]|uniref:tudor domain-containing protein 15 n=1 Tax=Tachyglossus aculeatus TaxID=9261 RepID=UPI0018F529EE|nr:tudor domain-containing protein 15 [Tachyglossus aculeatus]
MDSVPPPPEASDTDLRICHIECVPKEVLVKFQGRHKPECEFDYHILQSEIQHVPKVKGSVGMGEWCLVEEKESGDWHRGRVVEKINELYKVVLIDCGKEVKVSGAQLASANGDLFHLPPKVAFGILANILPIGEKWSAKAVNYFRSLVGLQVKGHTQALWPHQLVLFEVPQISAHILELKLGRLVDGDSFRLIVELIENLPRATCCEQTPGSSQRKRTPPPASISSDEVLPEFRHILDNLWPRLSVGTVTSVKVISARSPARFHCQLLQRLPELETLTAAMTSHYEAARREGSPPCDTFGVLCAAKRRNGQWQRGILQQLLPNDQVKIWFMDFGNSEAVPSRFVKKLKQEFLLAPLFSFPCSLSCFRNPDENTVRLQLTIFKQALLGQVVALCIDRFSDDRLGFVTLHWQDILRRSKHPQRENQRVSQSCPGADGKTTRAVGDGALRDPDKIPVDRFIGNAYWSRPEKGSFFEFGLHFKTVEMKIGSTHMAFVEYVLNPSSFWVRTNNHQQEFQDLMNKIAEIYDCRGNDELLLEKPQPGSWCCARYIKDMHFYRAVVTEVTGCKVNVYFLDFGNTESVPFYEVKTLLPELCELPALALCCSLAHVFPTEGLWVKSATDFFKATVFNRTLLLKVLAKKNDKYVVDVQCLGTSEDVSTITLMVEAGYAEYWGIKSECPPKYKNDYAKSRFEPEPGKCSVKQSRSTTSNSTSKSIQSIGRRCNSDAAKENNFPLSKFPGGLSSSGVDYFPRKSGQFWGEIKPLYPYKEFGFKPGTVIDVRCSHFYSPGDFSCQLLSRVPELMLLMKRIQGYYSVHRDPYQVGEVACVAKSAKDGLWYRAAVTAPVTAKGVDVVFVDWGNRERVFLTDLCAMNPEFMVLEGQAFTCSLNRIAPLNSESLKWTKEACADFGKFVSTCTVLTCTIISLLRVQPRHLCNVVDLQTPFVNVREFLISRGHAEQSIFSVPLPSPGNLCSYYFSSFNIKLGSEEEVYLSHICSPQKFYCQLKRNSGNLDVIAQKIAELSDHPGRLECDGNSPRPCIARYFADGLLYRAVATPIDSSYMLVNFVDFGNEQVVERDKLIPISSDCLELLFTPMQAIKCYLTSLGQACIPVELNLWFSEHFLGKPLKAVVVAKDSDGQLGLELFDGHQHLNQKIKSVLRFLERKGSDRALRGSQLLTSGKRDEREDIKEGHRRCKVIYSKNKMFNRLPGQGGQTDLPSALTNTVDQAIGPKAGCFQPGRAGLDKSKPDSGNPVNRPEAQWGLRHRHPEIESDPAGDPGADETWEKSTCVLREHLTADKHHPVQPKARSVFCPKYSDLPQPNVNRNTKIEGYVSAINSPLSFYIHLAEDEALILKLAEELNDNAIGAGQEKIVVGLVVGDLVAAEYAVDNAWYRAVINKVVTGESFEVEFIDYGNKAIVNVSKIHTLPSKFLGIPRLSFHSVLSGVEGGEFSELCGSKTLAYFSEKVNNRLVTCEFLQEHAQKWEVNIFYDEKSVINDLRKWIAGPEQQNAALKGGSPVTERKLGERSETCEAAPTVKPSPSKWGKIPNEVIKPGQLEMAKVLQVSKLWGNFYVRLTKNAQVTSDLTSLVAEEAKNSRLLAVENIEEGLECLAKSEETLKWYRATVKNRNFSKEKMLVFFIDRGTYEVVPLKDAKELSSEGRAVPRQAVPCKWVWLASSEKAFDLVVFAHFEVKILFLRYVESVWEVDILVNDTLLLEYVNFSSPNGKSKYRCAENAAPGDSEIPVTSVSGNSVKWAGFQRGRQYLGFVTVVFDPSDFWIQLEDSFDTMKTLFTMLSDLSPNLPTLPRDLIVTGSSGLVRFGCFDHWNRVEISEVSDKSVELLFIDYGFFACIPHSDLAHLKVVPRELRCLPRLTYPCVLYGVVPAKGEYWSKEAKALFQDLLSKPNLTFQMRGYSLGMKLQVDVTHEQSNVAERLVVAGHAVYSADFGVGHRPSEVPHNPKAKAFSQSVKGKYSPDENGLLPCSEKDPPQQEILKIRQKDVWESCTSKRLLFGNITAQKKTRYRKHKSRSNFKVVSYEGARSLEPCSDSKCEISSHENSMGNLPSREHWKAFNVIDFKTETTAFNIDEETTSKEWTEGTYRFETLS